MTISQQGLHLIKKWEGFRSKPYLDAAGVPTIGYGNTFYPDGRKVSLLDKEISFSEAEQLLLVVVKTFEKAVNRLVTSTLTQHQFDALVSLCYNIGTGNFQKSRLLKLVNQNPNDPEIYTEFLKHNKSKGVVLKGLQRRREDEANLYGVKKKLFQ